VRYEDLVSNPEDTIIKICEFIKINFNSKLLELDGLNKHLGDVEKYEHHKNVYKPISKESIGRGLKNLTEAEIKQINSVIADDLTKYHYEVWQPR
jgi:hypothetical protein